MRMFQILSFLGISMAAVLAGPAGAQQAQPSSADAPPKLERLEESAAPAVTIREPATRSTITEDRLPGGRRTEIRVKSGNSNYVVKPTDPHGFTQPGDAQSVGNRPAQWEILSFDPRRRQQQQETSAQAAAVPPPPTVTSPPPAK